MRLGETQLNFQIQRDSFRIQFWSINKVLLSLDFSVTHSRAQPELWIKNFLRGIHGWCFKLGICYVIIYPKVNNMLLINVWLSYSLFYWFYWPTKKIMQSEMELTEKAKHKDRYSLQPRPTKDKNTHSHKLKNNMNMWYHTQKFMLHIILT